MPRVSPEIAYANRVRVHELRHVGYSLRAIQEEMRFKSVASVQNYLKQPPPPVSPAHLTACVLDYSSTLGARRAIDMACAELGVPRDDMPVCESLLRGRVSDARGCKRSDHKGS